MEPFDDTVYANDGAEFLTEHNRASGLGDEEDRLSLSQVRLSISNSSVVNNGMCIALSLILHYNHTTHTGAALQEHPTSN